MANQGAPRQRDLIVVGATGYTGRLTVEQIAGSLDRDLTWTIAGRSRDKLERLATSLQQKWGDRSQPDIQEVSLADDLSTLLSQHKVCITLIGPYDTYGEAVLKACVEQGTHYVDSAGDLPFLERMVNKYQDTAKSKNMVAVNMVGCFGTPQDLLARATVQELNGGCEELILGVNKCFGSPSRGSLESLLQENRKPLQSSWALSPTKGPEPSAAFHRTDKDLGSLCATRLSADQDQALIHRAAGLTQAYGADFTYSEYERSSWINGQLTRIWLGLQMTLLRSPLKVVVRKMIPEGSGPDETGNEIDIEAVAVGAAGRAHGQFTFPGGPYQLTAVLLAQAAATLLADEIQYAGLITPSMLGDGYVRRLETVNIKIATKKLA